MICNTLRVQEQSERKQNETSSQYRVELRSSLRERQSHGNTHDEHEPRKHKICNRQSVPSAVSKEEVSTTTVVHENHDRQSKTSKRVQTLESFRTCVWFVRSIEARWYLCVEVIRWCYSTTNGMLKWEWYDWRTSIVMILEDVVCLYSMWSSRYASSWVFSEDSKLFDCFDACRWSRCFEVYLWFSFELKVLLGGRVTKNTRTVLSLRIRILPSDRTPTLKQFVGTTSMTFLLRVIMSLGPHGAPIARSPPFRRSCVAGLGIGIGAISSTLFTVCCDPLESHAP